MLRFINFSLLLCLATPLHAAMPLSPSLESRSSVSIKGNKYQITNTSYQVTHGVVTKSDVPLIVKTTQTLTQTMGDEKGESKVTLDFFGIDLKKKLYTIERPVDRMIFIAPDTIVATIDGCCGAESKYELIDLPSRVSFLEFRNQFLEIEMVNTEGKKDFRYFAFVPGNGEKLEYGRLIMASRYGLEQEIVFVFASKHQEFPHLPFTPRLSVQTTREKSLPLDLSSDTQGWPSRVKLEIFPPAGSKARLTAELLDKLELKFDLDCNDQVLMPQKIPLEHGRFLGSSEKSLRIELDKPRECTF